MLVELFHFNSIETNVLDSAIGTANKNFLMPIVVLIDIPSPPATADHAPVNEVMLVLMSTDGVFSMGAVKLRSESLSSSSQCWGDGVSTNICDSHHSWPSPSLQLPTQLTLCPLAIRPFEILNCASYQLD
jgi:hypothetical protein